MGIPVRSSESDAEAEVRVQRGIIAEREEGGSSWPVGLLILGCRPQKISVSPVGHLGQ